MMENEYENDDPDSHDIVNIKPQFALIRFQNEQKMYIVPVTDIRQRKVGKKNKYVFKKIDPAKDDDFLKRAWYYVRWYCEEGCEADHIHDPFLKAIILLMGGKFYLFIIIFIYYQL